MADKEEQGWCSGESPHLSPMWPGFDSVLDAIIWVDFGDSLICSERCSQALASRQKPTFDLLNFTLVDL